MRLGFRIIIAAIQFLIAFAIAYYGTSDVVDGLRTASPSIWYGAVIILSKPAMRMNVAMFPALYQGMTSEEYEQLASIIILLGLPVIFPMIAVSSGLTGFKRVSFCF